MSVPAFRSILEGQLVDRKGNQGQRSSLPPIVGSLFSWKSSFTKRITNDDCINTKSVSLMPDPHPRRNVWRATHLSHRCFPQQNQLHTTTWLGCRIRHSFFDDWETPRVKTESSRWLDRRVLVADGTVIPAG